MDAVKWGAVVVAGASATIGAYAWGRYRSAVVKLLQAILDELKRSPAKSGQQEPHIDEGDED